MRPRVSIRRLEVKEISAFVELIRAGLGGEILDKTIYGCHGIAEFVGSHLRAGELSPNHYVVAELEGRLVGAAEMAIRESDLFLNYISVSEDVRGNRIGTSLLGWTIEDWISDRPRSVIALDVFESNAVARGWYSSAGFRETSRIDWFVVPLDPDPRSSETVPCLGLPQANACHEKFGFSEFFLEQPLGLVKVGRLGDRWYRLTDSASCDDASVHKTLKSLDPNREILLVVENEENSSLGARFSGSIRMTAELSAAMSNLRNGTNGSPEGGLVRDN